MSDLICDVISKRGVLFSGNLSLIVVPGSEGDIGFMENHEPYVVALNDGVIRGRTASGRFYAAAIMGGYAQVLGRRVIIVCDRARALPSINEDKVKKRLAEVSREYEVIENSPSDEHIVTRSVLKRRMRWLEVQLHAKQKESIYY